MGHFHSFLNCILLPPLVDTGLFRWKTCAINWIHGSWGILTGPWTRFHTSYISRVLCNSPCIRGPLVKDYFIDCKSKRYPCGNDDYN